MSMSEASTSAEVLRCIYRACRARGYPPSMREIGRACGLASSSTVHYHLSRLQQAGLLRTTSRCHRAATITDAGYRWLGLL